MPLPPADLVENWSNTVVAKVATIARLFLPHLLAPVFSKKYSRSYPAQSTENQNDKRMPTNWYCYKHSWPLSIFLKVSPLQGVVWSYHCVISGKTPRDNALGCPAVLFRKQQNPENLSLTMVMTRTVIFLGSFQKMWDSSKYMWWRSLSRKYSRKNTSNIIVAWKDNRPLEAWKLSEHQDFSFEQDRQSQPPKDSKMQSLKTVPRTARSILA